MSHLKFIFTMRDNDIFFQWATANRFQGGGLIVTTVNVQNLVK